jgi:hypothetical protein
MTYLSPPWARVGNGKELQFFANDADVKEWLTGSLLEEFEPYHLVGSDLKTTGPKDFAEYPFRFELTDFPRCLLRESGSRFNLWILSEKLSPELEFKVGDPIERICGCNGLILLQHGLQIMVGKGSNAKTYRDSSRIAMLTEIQNLVTAEKRRVDAYKPIFVALCDTIKRALVCNSLNRNAEGLPVRGSYGPRMTASAVQMADPLFPFIGVAENSVTQPRRP